MNSQIYDLRNSEKRLLGIISKKISENEAFKLYDDLIIGDDGVLEQGKDKGKDRRKNILWNLQNL